MPKRDAEGNRLPRSFWSGTIAFGLVSLPVSLFVANRGPRVSLRMVDEDGTPLTRRFYCPKHERPVTADEIVRGYESQKDEFVVVEDDELDALAPEKSQEIDLRRFVALTEIDPVFFERAYFLVPAKGAVKAYRLLARAMEESGRAGVATFVMRGKEYLVAIIAERGILRAETLRFHDELRRPADVGLPEREAVEPALVESMVGDIDELAEDELERDDLVDAESQRLLALVQSKLAAGDDVVAAPEQLEPEEDEEGVVDLMKLLKESLGEPGAAEGRSTKKPGKAARSAKSGRATDRRQELAEQSKAELYERAKELEITGRSGMTKEQLIEAIRR